MKCPVYTVLVQCAVFSVPCAVCSTQYAMCSIQYAVCSMQYTVYSIQCAVCSVWLTVFIQRKFSLASGVMIPDVWCVLQSSPSWQPGLFPHCCQLFQIWPWLPWLRSLLGLSWLRSVLPYIAKRCHSTALRKWGGAHQTSNHLPRPNL